MPAVQDAVQTLKDDNTVGRPHTKPPHMKSKQLANVLIKILGLSLCTQSIMHVATGALNILASTGNMRGGPFLWSNFLTGVVLAGMGVYFIVRSQNVAGCLFKGEEE
jgi:hypothetical protein